MEHAFSLLAIPHTFYNTEECRNDFAWAVSFPFGTVFTFKGRIIAVVSVYHPVPWSQGTFCKIHFHPSNKNYYCCKVTNILIETFSFQKSFQLTVAMSKYNLQEGKSADFCLSCTRSSLHPWRQVLTDLSDEEVEDNHWFHIRGCQEIFLCSTTARQLRRPWLT